MDQGHGPRFVRWAPLALVGLMVGLFVVSAAGVPVPDGWVPAGRDILVFGVLLLLFGFGDWTQRTAGRDMVDRIRALEEDNARLRSEADRFVRDADVVRERFEAELRSLRLAHDEMRREQASRPS
jgi:uncharacterized membrane protein